MKKGERTEDDLTRDTSCTNAKGKRLRRVYSSN
ncbi:uncharacterized protein G2W53_023652 [Senna tora]|uniref:Uncharacterized protein n=1 Tax=Senna tora TaxID=362788 RepID=A0A834WD59_9FABA|nr:uncharacterized protein G2W53_023652 [Senna tora]